MTNREELVEGVLFAGRKLSTAAVLFHTALAARMGLSATEEKALDLLDRRGPMTAGDLARHTGLTPASVTALIGRLERKEAARRVAHPEDGRKVLIEFNREWAARVAPLFEDFVRSLRELCADYDDGQLATVARFMTDAAQRQEESTRRLG
ncbi:MarR family transcriptional regulator [Streptomyces sp. MST-110588]|uniref:MarR family winged helix-turn-helix transcriptional regulator n=1 Tax=Streptomyces sp. MST-110588 TaxID=2833628 RepID=UPI001F5CE5B1|nr:MarR family transcriptional regulator [Streptomyces sp. MST-110588]UNO42667.1 MarR family transcriptional regulator [Streptomyces sp. MST-110588]